MRMEATLDAQAVDPLSFHLTGGQPGAGSLSLAGVRPASLAPYASLAQLRYDFPLVLTGDDAAGAPVLSLSGAIDALLQKIAPTGIEHERLRRTVLRLEREIRALSAAGETGLLSQLWDKAAARLDRSDDALLQAARAALELDGPVLDCDAAAAGELVAHLWAAAQEKKARRFRDASGRLMAGLAGVLRADYLRSAEGRSAAQLRASVGPAHQGLVDFGRLSELLPKSTPRDALPKSRRTRIEWALSVLERQRFFAVPAAEPRPEPYGFRFETCGDALTAYRARLHDMVELVKAMAIARLEIEGTYNEARHDALFAGFDADALSPQDRAQFPDYLLIVGGGATPFDNTGLLAVLSSAIPLKIAVMADDIVAGSPAGDSPSALGVRSTQLAGLVIGLGDVFVLQSASSNLYRLRERLMRGLAFEGPALFSIYAGSPGSGLPPYLDAAAAMQSRAFPAFSHDPGAGPDLASRFSLENNPQAEADWPAVPLEYADRELQRVRQDVAFTYIDFLIALPRYCHRFIAAPDGFEPARMVPAAEWIAREPDNDMDGVPFVFAADEANRLSRLITDRRAMGAARQCLDNWHRLQELGGVHNSHAERLLRQERQAWEERQAQAAPPPVPQAKGEPAPAAAEAKTEPAEPSPGAAYIETARCSSCNECTQLNNKMFAYDANKQAYIADVGAGTYAQLVEAAENCQLGIIHPGKPLNDDEPGLDELIKRAEPFL